MVRKGFTLVELLTVVGIITVLLAILIPVVARARSVGQLTICQSNVRQLVLGLNLYANQWKNYPPNASTTPAKWWTDYDRVGMILARSSQSDLRGPAFTCPNDDGSVRSYAMNVWASSYIEKSLLASNTGTLWGATSRLSTQLILISETWSGSGNAATGFYATQSIGRQKVLPGLRFGGGAGANFNAGRFGLNASELNYSRHRSNRGPGLGYQPVGSVNIGFADGHVELKRSDELYVPETGRSTLKCLWCVDDASRDF